MAGPEKKAPVAFATGAKSAQFAARSPRRPKNTRRQGPRPAARSRSDETFRQALLRTSCAKSSEFATFPQGEQSRTQLG